MAGFGLVVVVGGSGRVGLVEGSERGLARGVGGPSSSSSSSSGSGSSISNVGTGGSVVVVVLARDRCAESGSGNWGGASSSVELSRPDWSLEIIFSDKPDVGVLGPDDDNHDGKEGMSCEKGRDEWRDFDRSVSMSLRVCVLLEASTRSLTKDMFYRQG